MNFTELFGNARFVAPSRSCGSPYMHKRFRVPEFDRARLLICGLGFFEGYLNGARIGEDLLVPANSQFEKRMADLLNDKRARDAMTYRIYCLQYDVTALLKTGENTLGVHLGKGWYNQPTDAHMSGEYCETKLAFRLQLFCGEQVCAEVLSDETMLWKQSEITENDIYRGEMHDERLCCPDFSENSCDTADWEQVVPESAPESEFQIQDCPADRVIRTIAPVMIRDFGQTRIYDCLESVSGFAAIKAGKAGETITVRYADALCPDGTLDFAPTGGESRIQQDIFAFPKKGKEYVPHFCWHAFRYVELCAGATLGEVRVVHADCPVTADFDCDNEVFNWLFHTYIRTQLDNMHCGVPSDCPHIERLGYTGDGQLCAEAGMLLLDSRRFYRKWMQDIADSQDTFTGHVQHTAPFAGGGGGPAAWGGAIVMVPYYYWKTYGDTAVLQEYLPKMLHYFDYMESRTENGLVFHEVDGAWCLGDWCAPTEIRLPVPHSKSKCRIPESFVNTALLVKQLLLACDMAKAIGREEETEKLGARIASHRRALEIAYYSPMYHDFCGNVQGANAFAVDIGLGTKETVKTTAAQYRERGMLDTGIVATDLLPRVLLENGEAQTAFDLLTSKGDISYDYMMKHGATTLWEDWHPERSLNHPMFGAVTRYLFQYFLGIRQEPDSAGFREILIAPCLVTGLERASGSLLTVRGRIGVSYEKAENEVRFSVTLPEGAQARFRCGETQRILRESVNNFRIPLDLTQRKD